MVNDIEDNTDCDRTYENQTSIVQKFQIDLIKELWSNVITTKCPHCQKNSPAIRKDGYTKLFVKPLIGKSKAGDEQRKRMRGQSDLESRTVASTNKNESRKASTVNEDIESDQEEIDLTEIIDDEVDGDHTKEGGQQKYISPSEVKEHIQKLWSRESNFLNLMYGKF